MSEQPTAGSSKAAKKNTAKSKVPESPKVSLKAPPRVTTVQKLHLRLQQAGIERRTKPDITADITAVCQQVLEASKNGSSRESSPGIDQIPPPAEPMTVRTQTSCLKKQEVKRTAAQIFRELARCKAEQDAEVKRISTFEFIATPEEAVNKTAIELEEREALARTERRMLALMSLENSIASKDKSLEQKRKIGCKALEEKHKIRRLVADLRSQEQSIVDQVRLAVRCMRERSRNAVAAAIQVKAVEAKIFGEENQALVREAQKQKEEERQSKAALIQKIRELEAIALPYVRELDFTETAGHGLLGEMSIVELNERLALLRMQRAYELKEKNKKIIYEKKRQEEQMEMAEEVLSRFHEMQEIQRHQRRELANQKPPPVTSERVEQLKRELDEKRSERLQRSAQRRLQWQPQRQQSVEEAAPPIRQLRSAPACHMRDIEQLQDGRGCASDSCVQMQQQLERLAERPTQYGLRRHFV